MCVNALHGINGNVNRHTLLFFGVFTLIMHQGVPQRICLDESDPRGALYRGKLRRAESGKKCVSWSSANSVNGTLWVQNPWSHYNYCRNPESDEQKPWCFVTRNSWEFCNVKNCKDVCGIQTIMPSFSNQHYHIWKGNLLPRKRLRRVIGGDVATHGSWPWVVSVRLARDGPHLCGGTLIDKSWVVTAAHCVERARVSKVTVFAGHHFGTERQTQTRGTKRIIINPNFSSELVTKDIALIQLQTPFEMTSHVRVACLPSPEYIVPRGTYCISVGWGYNGDPPYPTQLKQAVLPVHSYKFCLRKMGYDMNDRTQMCAGWDGTGHGTCTGDSGGPLLCLGLNNRRWTIHGINSWSMNMCDDGKGGIEAYTRVSKFVRWIKQQMALHADQ